MVEAFAECGEFESHRIDTTRATTQEVRAQVERGLCEGRFDLGWRALE